MSTDKSVQSHLAGNDAAAKRELLAQLLRKRAAANQKEFPLALGQEDLWLLGELAPQTPAYHIPFSVRIKSAVDYERLERSLRIVIERYPILQCVFVRDAEGLKQRVAPLPERCLEQIDASGWSEEKLRQQVNDTYRRPFDLSQGPAFRPTIFIMPEKGDVFLLAVHHIIFDAWSLGIFLEDLALVYENGPATPLPEGAAPYSAFVKWQKDMISSSQGAASWDYWNSRLKDLQSPVDLPTDFPRPSALTFRGAAHHFELSAELSARVREFARIQNVTPFAVLAAGFHSLLHRYTGAREIPIGTPVSGRSLPQFERAVGYFVNPVIISAPLDAHTTFRQHLADIRASIIGAQEHGDFPFIEIVRRIRPERDPGRTPLFQVMLNLIKATQVGIAGNVLHEGNSRQKLGPFEIDNFPLDQQEAQFDLDLTLLDTGSSMPASLSYNTELFEPSTAARFAGHFVTLLSSALSDPDLPVSDLQILTPDEAFQVVTKWNSTDRAYPDQTIHGFIEQQVERSPEMTALIFEGHKMTFAELNHRANQLARYLQKLGVAPGALVAVLMERSFEMVIALLGILKAGGAYVPVDTEYPPERQLYMLRDAAAPVILTQAKFVGQIESADGQVVALDELWSKIADAPGGNLPSCAQPDDLAYVIYTSGSTGDPKGAMNTHRAVCNRLLWMQEQYGITESDAVLQKTPFSFDVSVWEFFWPLMTGARLVIARPEGHRDPIYLAEIIQNERVTTLHFVPSMLRAFLQAASMDQCGSIRRVICSGEALSYDLQKLFHESIDAELHNLYGPTEAAVDVTYWACERSGSRKTVPIGRPVANTRIYILDSKMRPTPIGVPGELYIGGVQVGKGYWRKPDLTEKRFIADPFVSNGRLYRTGDVAKWLPDGVIEYLGRADQQVKIRGFRIELEEIEHALRQDTRVEQAVVTTYEDAGMGKSLVAYIVSNKNDAATSASLKEALAQKLPNYMVPSLFHFLDAIPLTPNGKLDRRALPSPAPAQGGTRIFVAPQTETEKELSTIWKEVLHVERIGREDNFFELGGHSLLATSMLSRVWDQWRIRLSLRSVFETQTLERFAARIETIVWATADPVNEIEASEEREVIEL